MKRAALCALHLLFVGCFSRPTKTYLHPPGSMSVYKKIAVLPFHAENGNGTAMADSFVTGFMSAGFQVVERGLLEGVFRSLGLDFESGVLRPQEMVQVGKLAGVDAVLFGTLHADSDKDGGEVHSVALRLVDVNTGEVILSSAFRNEKYLPFNQIPTEMMKNIRSQLNKWESQLRRKAKKAAKVKKKKGAQDTPPPSKDE